MKPEFYITSCYLKDRYTEKDPLDEMELEQEVFTMTIRFSGSGDTRGISNDELVGSVMKKIKTIP